jgi:hypothetical protein
MRRKAFELLIVPFLDDVWPEEIAAARRSICRVIPTSRP